MVIAAGLLGSAVNVLQGVKVLPGSTAPFFDISGVLSDQSGVGAFLRGLFGYNATPTALQFGVWLVFLLVAVLFWNRSYSAAARPA